MGSECDVTGQEVGRHKVRQLKTKLCRTLTRQNDLIFVGVVFLCYLLELNIKIRVLQTRVQFKMYFREIILKTGDKYTESFTDSPR